MPDQFKLSNPPTDTISRVIFQPNSNQYLLASSWDTYLHLYDVNTNGKRLKLDYEFPILDCCFSDASTVFAGGIGNTLKSYDCNTGKSNVIGYHKQPISQVHFSNNESLLVTGSWDSTVGLWDPRLSGQQTAVRVLPQPGDVYTLDTTSASGSTYLVVGTEKRFVYIWDMRKLDQAVQMRESSLKYQTRCIRCFPNGQGYALASIEGRVAVEFFDQSPEQQKRKYAFKCHRMKMDDVEFIYPVNVIAFHMVFNTFATGGCDSLVNVWDGFNRKRLVQLPQYPTSISSLGFSSDGSTLAIASSYTYEKGELSENEIVEPNIFVRYPSDQEVRPNFRWDSYPENFLVKAKSVKVRFKSKISIKGKDEANKQKYQTLLDEAQSELGRTWYYDIRTFITGAGGSWISSNYQTLGAFGFKIGEINSIVEKCAARTIINAHNVWKKFIARAETNI